MTLEGDPWFVVSDICRVLGIYIQPNGKPNVAAACQKIEADEQGMNPIHTPSGYAQPMRCVSESGLYKLIMRCDKPIAKDFQNHVAKEILPSIRKTGSFVTATQ